MSVLALGPSANGRVSGKAWKLEYKGRSQDGVKAKSFEDRMTETKKAQAIKKIERELKEEKQAEATRRKEITLARKKATEERRRLEEDRAKMGARKAARLRRKAGRSKKVNG